MLATFRAPTSTTAKRPAAFSHQRTTRSLAANRPGTVRTVRWFTAQRRPGNVDRARHAPAQWHVHPVVVPGGEVDGGRGAAAEPLRPLPAPGPGSSPAGSGSAWPGEARPLRRSRVPPEPRHSGLTMVAAPAATGRAPGAQWPGEEGIHVFPGFGLRVLDFGEVHAVDADKRPDEQGAQPGNATAGQGLDAHARAAARAAGAGKGRIAGPGGRAASAMSPRGSAATYSIRHWGRRRWTRNGSRIQRWARSARARGAGWRQATVGALITACAARLTRARCVSLVMGP